MVLCGYDTGTARRGAVKGQPAKAFPFFQKRKIYPERIQRDILRDSAAIIVGRSRIETIESGKELRPMSAEACSLLMGCVRRQRFGRRIMER